jgi:hypothetical protein
MLPARGVLQSMLLLLLLSPILLPPRERGRKYMLPPMN